MAALTILQAKDALQLSKPSFEEMNLNRLSFAKEMEFAIQAFEKNTFLLSTTGVDKVLTNIVLAGLSLSPILRYAYLVPRKIGKNYVCCVDPSYQGLCKILTDTGSVVGISATIVYEKEVQSLDVQQGMGGHARHDNYYGYDKPGKPIACYSIAILPNGMKHVELLRPWEWEAIKARSESVKSYNNKKAAGEYAPIPTWETDLEEMIRKTCLKKHYKYLPKTERALMAAKAIDLDNQTNGFDLDEQGKATATKIPNATPDALVGEAYATEEDFETLMKLLNGGVIGNPFLAPGYEKFTIDALVKALTKHKEENTLLKDKAEAYISWFKWEEQEVGKKSAEQPAEGEPANG